MDLLIKQIKESPEKDDLAKVEKRKSEIISASKFSEEDVLKDISNMSLKELYECREVLKDNEKKELDGKVVAKAKEYADGKGVIPTSEDLYILRDLLGKASDIDYNDDTKNAIIKCKQKVSDDIANFEGFYGINEQLLSPDKVKENLDFIENKIPSAEDLFEDNSLSELKEVKGVLDNLVIKGDFTLWGRKTIKGKEAEEIKSLLKEQVYQDTSRYLANTKENDLGKEEFAQEYSDRMKMALLRMFEAEDVVKVIAGKKPDNLGKKFEKLIKQAKPFEINREVIASYNAISNVEANTATKRLKLKSGYDDVVSRYKAKIKTLDEKCKKQHKTLYTLAKTALKSGAWGVAYGVAGAAFGPVGIAAVSSASFINASYGMYKDYKKQKAAARENKETLSFGKYMKKNSTRVAGMVLSTAAATMGIGGATGAFADPAVIANAQVLIRGSAISLGAANVVKAYRNAPKGKKWGAALTAAGSFAVGFVAGRAGAGAVGEFGNSVQTGEYHSIEENVVSINTGEGDTINNQLSQQLQDNQPVVDNTQKNDIGNTQQYQQNDHNSGSGSNTDNSQGNIVEGNITSNENGEFQEQTIEHEEGNSIDDSMNNSELQTQNVAVGEKVDILDSSGKSVYQVEGKEGYNTSYTEGYYSETEPNIVKVEYEEIATGNKEVVYVGMDAPLFKEEYGDHNNLLSYTEFINGKEEVLVSEYEYDENCDKVIKTTHYERDGYVKEVVETTYNEDGSKIHNHYDGDGNLTHVVNVSNAGEQSIEMRMGDVDLNNNQDISSQDVSENNGGGKENTLKGNNAEQDNNQTQNTEAPSNVETMPFNEDVSTTPQGGENSGEDNKAESENIATEQTTGKDDNTEKQSDGKLSEEEKLAHMSAQVWKEDIALDNAYGQHYMNNQTGECYVKDVEGNILLKGNDPNELNRNIAIHKNELFKMDTKLHNMEKDTQEYQDLADKLNNELDRLGMVRDEETGRMMSKGDYTALQEQRQAETQAVEKADTLKGNNAEQDNSGGKSRANIIDRLRGIGQPPTSNSFKPSEVSKVCLNPHSGGR